MKISEVASAAHVEPNAQEPGGASQESVTDLEAKLSRLKCDLTEAQMERDIVKNLLLRTLPRCCYR